MAMASTSGYTDVEQEVRGVCLSPTCVSLSSLFTWGRMRCDGVSDGTIDVPAALIEHFPEHGPYLGVYAQVRGEGDVSVGDACEYYGG